jgi:hypothetical protein
MVCSFQGMAVSKTLKQVFNGVEQLSTGKILCSKYNAEYATMFWQCVVQASNFQGAYP